MFWIDRIHAFSDNYIWALRNDRVQNCVLVDPGDAAPVIDYLTQHQLSASQIIITHHHRDHTGGVAELKRLYQATVYGPKNNAIKTIDVRLKEGDTLPLNDFDLQFEVLEVPGHTLDHIAYYSPGILFCGDTLFAGGCGRMFEGTQEQMWASLQKLAKLPADTLVYCAHEYTAANLAFAEVVDTSNSELQHRILRVRELRQKGQPTVPSTIGIEKETNPFLRCHLPEIRQAAETFCGRPLSTEAEVFGTVRSWKDQF
jgi:hydroxyacylglutathione hydrolase